MDVIGHDDKIIQDDVFIMIWQVIPRELNDLPQFIQYHLFTHDLAKQRRTVFGDDGNEITTF